MNSECNFLVKTAYRHNILQVLLWIFPLLACLFMVWATMFYDPEEWYITFLWAIGLCISLFGLYYGIFGRATVTANNKGIKYDINGKVVLQLKWDDIEFFRTYKSNVVPNWAMPKKIGVVYSKSYKNEEISKWEDFSKHYDGVHQDLPLSNAFSDKKRLVDMLNLCKNKYSN